MKLISNIKTPFIQTKKSKIKLKEKIFLNPNLFFWQDENSKPQWNS